MTESRRRVPSGARLRRRGFLAAAGGGALATGVRLGAGGTDRAAARPNGVPKRFATRLPIPEVLTDADLVIPIREAEVDVLPGKPTEMWTYGGTFPGPTIRRPASSPTRITFQHRLPKKAGELTVHLHGGHNRPEHDGQPGGLTTSQPRALYCDLDVGASPRQSGNDLLISPGGSRTYEYDHVEDGAPERAAFQWYHDHRLERTGPNVWRGLAGMFILDDEFDASLPLPRGDRDIPLLLADRSFDTANQLTNPFPGCPGRRTTASSAATPS